MAQLPNTRYAVGWITALPHEKAAAIAMLDTKHAPPLSKHESDRNIYTLGSIRGPNGVHNVAIASLPSGQYGTTSAAVAAVQMLASFPAIKFGLMVGIGGGIPSQDNDIRLGDVIVSQPEGLFGGVRQYDSGKVTASGYEERSALNSPPRVLLNAMSALKCEHEIQGSAIPNILQAMREKYPLMAKPRTGPGYVYQGATNDKLFLPHYEHMGGNKSGFSFGPDCSNCDKAQEVSRPDRSDQDPYIHYGIIASGNQVIKNAFVRDGMSKSHKCLCFETEAAGLMNDFPCIVIRGVADYCDSHKNDQWQKYAAATAAAYAKELLQITDVTELEGTPVAKELMSELRGIRDDIADAKEHFQMNREELRRTEFLNKLSPINFELQHIDLLSRRQSGTGLWFLENPKYQAWLNSNGDILFCPGMPGAGKTILTSIVIEDLHIRFQENPNKFGIAYIYCNFGKEREQGTCDLLFSLFKQLAQHSSLSVEELCQKHKIQQARPGTPDGILESLQSMASAYSKTYIIIDALDELKCRAEFLPKLFQLHETCCANILVTSRFLPDITDKFLGRTTLEIYANNEDVRLYLDGQVLKSGRLLLQKHCEYIKAEIVKVVRGMFLLAQLHFDWIKSKTTFKTLEAALNNLSRGQAAYTTAYENAMKRISSQAPEYKALANQVIAWIASARRPLSILELQHAVAVEIGQPKFDDGNLPEIEDMASVCAGLVVIDKKSKIIRLVHYTTQQYFEETWKNWFPDVHDNISKICVTYLSYEAFRSGHCLDDKEFEARLQSNPLYDYAARNWAHHSRKSSIRAGNLLLTFLENDAAIVACRQAMNTYVRLSSTSQNSCLQFPKRTKGLHLLAYVGLEEPIEKLVSKNNNLNEEDSDGRTPLHIAIIQGHNAVAELLINKGASLEVQDAMSRLTPLGVALRSRNIPMIALLWEKGPKNIHLSYWLEIAVRKKDEELLKLLAEREIDKNMTSLLQATRLGYETAVHILIGNGANLEIKDHQGCTPLLIATAKNYEKLTELLIIKGANLEITDHKGRTPLLIAVENNYKNVVKLLIEKQANMEKEYHDVHFNKFTPLLMAIAKNYEEVAELLIKKGANIDAKDSDDVTPLLMAVEKNYEKVAEILIKNGANLEVRDDEGYTPLLRAVANNSGNLAGLLIRNGADTEARQQAQYGPGYITRNQHNSLYREDFLELAPNRKADLESEEVLKSGEDLESEEDSQSESELDINDLGFEGDIGESDKDIKFKRTIELENFEDFTPLFIAVYKNNDAIINLLLDNGADLEARCRGHLTPLMLAIEQKRQGIIRLLSERGADLGFQYSQTSTPLHTILGNDFGAAVELLLEDSSDIGAKGVQLYTSRLLTIEKSQKTGIKLLLEGNQKTNAAFFLGSTPTFLDAELDTNLQLSITLQLYSDPDFKPFSNQHIYTPLFLAFDKKSKETSWLLMYRRPRFSEKRDHKECETLLLAIDRKQGEATLRQLVKERCGVKRASIRLPLPFESRNPHKNAPDCTINLFLRSGHNIDLEARDSQGYTPFSLAFEIRLIETMKTLLENGARFDPRAKDSRGYTLLFRSIESGFEDDIVQKILDQGASIQERDPEGRTPLHLAIKKGMGETTIKLLLNRGASLKEKDTKGRTPFDLNMEKIRFQLNKHKPLPSAMERKLITVAKLLMYEEMGSEYRDSQGRTLLIRVIDKTVPNQPSTKSFVRLLLDCGFDLEARDSLGRTPLFVASEKSNHDIIKLLLDKGADLEVRDSEGRTPLIRAIETSKAHFTETVKLILDHGAKLNVSDYQSRTPLYYAVKNIARKSSRENSVIKLLIDRGASIRCDALTWNLFCDIGLPDKLLFLWFSNQMNNSKPRISM